MPLETNAHHTMFVLFARQRPNALDSDGAEPASTNPSATTR